MELLVILFISKLYARVNILKAFGDLVTNCIEYTKSICKAERYDYVYDSYL